MNVLTAIAIPFAGAMIYGVQLAPPPVVRYLLPGGAAEAAGLQPGDRIVVFDGRENPRWRTIADDALLSPGKDLPLEVERNGQRVKLTIKPTSRTEQGETMGTLDFFLITETCRSLCGTSRLIAQRPNRDYNPETEYSR